MVQVKQTTSFFVMTEVTVSTKTKCTSTKPHAHVHSNEELKRKDGSARNCPRLNWYGKRETKHLDSEVLEE